LISGPGFRCGACGSRAHVSGDGILATRGTCARHGAGNFGHGAAFPRPRTPPACGSHFALPRPRQASQSHRGHLPQLPEGNACGVRTGSQGYSSWAPLRCQRQSLREGPGRGQAGGP
jgi:hypothetical protein